MDLEAITRRGRRAGLVLVILWLSATAAFSQDAALTPLAELGKRVFFDETMSATGTQSCASCHAPDVGFSGPNERFNRMGAYEGAVHGTFGKRKPQTAAYVGSSPVLHIETLGGVTSFVGGSFWDGRAVGLRLKDPLAEQAQGPLLNPVEQALPALRGAARLLGTLCRPLWQDQPGYVRDCGLGRAALPGRTTGKPRPQSP